MFTTVRYANGVERDAVDEAWKWRCETHNERYNAAPVCGVTGRVAIHAVEVVHIGHGYVATPSDVITDAKLVSTVPLARFMSEDCYLLCHQYRRHWS
jgi:hypothetical protein